MDFSKLSRSDLVDFLSRFYPNYDKIFPSVEHAKELFEYLQTIPGTRFPVPVVDLYLASLYEGPKDEFYHPKEILNLTPQQVRAFDDVFHFNARLNNLETNRRRILRILDYLGLVFHEETIFLQPTVLEHFCQNLSVDDLNKFRLACHLKEIPCNIPVQDQDGKITSVDRLNDLTYLIIRDIKELGSTRLLVYSSENGRNELVKFLLERGVDPNAKTWEDQTALMLAVKHGHLEIVNILLEAGADPNHQDPLNDNHTALDYARSNPEIINLLIRYGGRKGVELA
jgi:hypothetical protein